MSKATKKIFPYLTYAGVIPFIFCSFCLSIDVRHVPLLGSVEKILSVYALVISSFLAGTHWGQHFQIQGIWSRALPILSNIIAVSLWFGFLALSFKNLTAMFVVVFIILLGIEHCLYKNNLITQQYYQTRCLVSAMVIVSLGISGIIS